MEFRVLGPLEVVADGAPLRLGGPLQRAVLAVLVLRANEPVPTDVLVDALWRRDVPRSARGVVHTYLSRLRRTLAEAGGPASIGRSSGYTLQLDEARVDAHRFERLADRGRSAAARGDPVRAAATLRHALGLWRGDVLADLPDLEPARQVAARLEQLRLAVLEVRVEADLALGRHDDVAAELELLTELYPFRERLWGQRMVALYRSGRQTDALAAYDRVRRILLDQFGVRPGPELQALEHSVLRQDRDLDAAAATGRPVELVPAHRIDPAERRDAPLGLRRVAPLPPSFAHPAEDRPLFDRDGDKALLMNAFEAVATGHFGAVFVAGPPGIGKTALAGWFARSAHARGATVLLGRADEGLEAPFQPLGEAIAQWTSNAGSDQLARLGGVDAAYLGLITGDVEHGGGRAPGTDRQRLFAAIRHWLEAAASPGANPVVVVLEDLQWADPLTLLAVRHLLRHPPAAGALLVATHRDTEIDPGHPLEAVVEVRGGGVHRVLLAGLTADGVAALVRTGAGGHADGDDPALAAELSRVTGGNPLFVVETLRHLAELTAVPGAGSGLPPRLGDAGVPAGVRQVIDQRLRLLPARTVAVLRQASVLGERFDVPLLGQIVDRPELAVVEAIEPALAARLIEPAGGDPVAGASADRFQFSHPVVREAIVDGLGLVERARVHWRTGTTIAARHATDPEAHLAAVAHHLTAGVRAGDVTTAVTANVRAGRHALATLAFEDALRRFVAATELLDAAAGDAVGAGLAYEAWLGLGQAGDVLLDVARQRAGYLAAARIARRHGWPERLAPAATGFAIYAAGAADPRRGDGAHLADAAVAEALMDEAVAGLHQTAAPARARLLAIRATYAAVLDRTTDARSGADAAVREARAAEDPEALSFALIARQWTQFGEPFQPDLHDVPERALALPGAPNDLVARREFVFPVLPLAAFQLGRRAEVDGARDRVAGHLDTRRSRQLSSWVRAWDAALALAAGRFADAERLSAGLLHPAGWAMWEDVAGLQLVVSAAERGDPSARPGLERYLTEAPRVIAPELLLPQAILAALEAAAGDPDRAAGRITALRRRRSLADLGWSAPIALRHLGEAAAHLRWTALAADLVPILEPYGGQLFVSFGGVTVDGAADRTIGQVLSVLGHHDEAVRRLDAARSLERRFGAPALAARSTYWLARARRDRDGPGDRAAARALRHEAGAAADRLGLASLRPAIVHLAAS